MLQQSGCLCTIVHARVGIVEARASSEANLHDRASRNDQLAAVIRSRRASLGLRQDQLAELANCSTRFVHVIESGKETVRFDKLLDVLEVLGLSLEVTIGNGSVVVVRDLG
ncbi:MAG: helix-turn-helix transcriptional regulator [Hamadaea sp.]|nr:helix-turn-helix transcriptional regulator [Hamadaea sp.]